MIKLHTSCTIIMIATAVSCCLTAATLGAEVYRPWSEPRFNTDIRPHTPSYTPTQPLYNPPSIETKPLEAPYNPTPLMQPDNAITGNRSMSMAFRVRSEYKYKAQIAFYSQTRKGHYWGAYDLNDYDTHTISINCQAGEQICYGAWDRGASSPYWGVGPNDTHSCTRCCWSCGDSATINLVE